MTKTKTKYRVVHNNGSWTGIEHEDQEYAIKLYLELSYPYVRDEDGNLDWAKAFEIEKYTPWHLEFKTRFLIWSRWHIAF